MFKKIRLERILFMLLFFAIATGWGSRNATTMEYRSAKTAARSERDLNRAEEFALKALDMKEHANDASVAFFLATEVYKPKKMWKEMNEMLDLALKINPEQKLKGFSALKSRKKEVVKDAIAMYKEELWVNIFNSGFSKYDRGKFELALEDFILASTILDKIENYLAIADIYMLTNNPDKAIENLNIASKMDPNNYDVSISLANHYYSQSNFEEAMNFYNKALNAASNKENKNNVLRMMLDLSFELKDYDRAIEIKNELEVAFSNDADFMYNVGALYQNLARNLYYEAIEKFNEHRNSAGTNEELVEIYHMFSDSLEAAEEAIESFEITQSISSEYIDTQITDLEELVGYIEINTELIEDKAYDEGFDYLLFD
tara:strand:+ start:4829 stop:5947 length:1119 start_codon:yes stop_codon:yes gene_type:complete